MISSRVPGDAHSKFAIPSLRASASGTPRRVNHGGAAWLKRHDDELRQPQDGAPRTYGNARQESLKLKEAEDAQITGATRSLGRRLLGLNVAARASAALPGASVLRQLLPKRPFLPKAALSKA